MSTQTATELMVVLVPTPNSQNQPSGVGLPVGAVCRSVAFDPLVAHPPLIAKSPGSQDEKMFGVPALTKAELGTV